MNKMTIPERAIQKALIRRQDRILAIRMMAKEKTYSGSRDFRDPDLCPRTRTADVRSASTEPEKTTPICNDGAVSYV
jgi:hypothetical protein